MRLSFPTSFDTFTTYHVALDSGAAPGERTILDHTIWREGVCCVPRGPGGGEQGMMVPADTAAHARCGVDGEEQEGGASFRSWTEQANPFQPMEMEANSSCTCNALGYRPTAHVAQMVSMLLCCPVNEQDE